MHYSRFLLLLIGSIILKHERKQLGESRKTARGAKSALRRGMHWGRYPGISPQAPRVGSTIRSIPPGRRIPTIPYRTNNLIDHVTIRNARIISLLHKLLKVPNALRLLLNAPRKTGQTTTKARYSKRARPRMIFTKQAKLGYPHYHISSAVKQ